MLPWQGREWRWTWSSSPPTVQPERWFGRRWRGGHAWLERDVDTCDQAGTFWAWRWERDGPQTGKKTTFAIITFLVYTYQNSTVDVEKKYVWRKVCCKCIKDIITCLNTCIPLRAATPINKKTPYRTGIGITWKQTELGQLIYSLTQCRT